MNKIKTGQVLLANPRGFCAGVERAIEIVERVLEQFGRPIYVRHEVVHNKFVVEGLRDKGAVFIEEISEVPDNATLIFSAHGVSKAVRAEADVRGLRVFDATCPLVTKVHLEVVRYERDGQECILIGHAGHPEVEGTLGQYKNREGGIYLVESVDDVEKLVVKNPDKLSFVTQTTLSMDDTAVVIEALQKRFPNIKGPKRDDICYATQNRQDAVKALAEQCDLILVVGSCNSSNSNRLREMAERQGANAYLIDNAGEVDAAWLVDASTVGVTAGASVPEVLVEEVIAYLKVSGVERVKNIKGREENIVFSLPRDLQKA
ncbi:4-hydroxy-3-methylbut-2-enyl diphosphate reductase [hydrothermal vent metagenome]|uniref:4-hydroxy-3-methylbut-2-enyl diphosphate reductase n=1 Tax=hydrothermal vent metagenome TaxID=652676 RepID=A0A3B1A5R5_9ZZZZ